MLPLVQTPHLKSKSVRIINTTRQLISPYYVRVLGGDTDCPLQVCQLSRSSESTHFRSLRRDVALFDSTRAPDGI